MKATNQRSGEEALGGRSRGRGRVAMMAMLLFFTIMLMFGGGARADALSQFPARVCALLIIGVGCTVLSVRSMWRLGVPLLFASAAGLLLIAQLVPLPPDIWVRLGDRSRFAALAEFSDFVGLWRPLSLNSDGTLNALFAMLPSFAAILLTAYAAARNTSVLLLSTLLGYLAITGLVGVVQFASGGHAALYPYAITNSGSAVGLFANRNHQAAALACALPMLAGWVATREQRMVGLAALPVIATALLVIALLLMTGSRAGFVLMLIGLAGAVAQLVRSRRIHPWYSGHTSMVIVAGCALVVVLGGALFFSNSQTSARLFSDSINSDMRVQVFRPLIAIARQYMPLGTGFGTFPDVYKVYEPNQMLMHQYLNHAHDDLLELAIEGGLPALSLLGFFLVWWYAAARRVWHNEVSNGVYIQLGRAGSVVSLVLLCASAVDYPLRTPALSSIFTIACCWMHLGRGSDLLIWQGRSHTRERTMS